MSLTISAMQAIAIIPMFTGTSSLIASSFVLYMIWRSYIKLTTTYHRLMFCLCSADIVLSLILSLSSLLGPRDEDIPGMLYVLGNQVSCDTQGFVFVMACTCLNFYLCGLTGYFLLAIKMNISDEIITKYYEPIVHVFSIGYSLFGAIFVLTYNGGYYFPTDNICWIAPKQASMNCSDPKQELVEGYNDQEIQVLSDCDRVRNDVTMLRWLFLAGPTILTFTVVTINMLIIFWTLRNQKHERAISISIGDDMVPCSSENSTPHRKDMKTNDLSSYLDGIEEDDDNRNNSNKDDVGTNLSPSHFGDVEQGHDYGNFHHDESDHVSDSKENIMSNIDEDNETLSTSIEKSKPFIPTPPEVQQETVISSTLTSSVLPTTTTTTTTSPTPGRKLLSLDQELDNETATPSPQRKKSSLVQLYNETKKKNKKKSKSERLREEGMQQCLFYIVMYLVCNIIPFLQYSQLSSLLRNDDIRPFWLQIGHQILYPLQGLIIFAIFVRPRVSKTLHKNSSLSLRQALFRSIQSKGEPPSGRLHRRRRIFTRQQYQQPSPHQEVERGQEPTGTTNTGGKRMKRRSSETFNMILSSEVVE